MMSQENIQQLDCSNRKHGVHFGHPQQFLNSRAYPRDTQSNLVALTADVMASQHAEAERIHVWNLRQVKNVRGWVSIARRRFEEIANSVRRQGRVHTVRGERAGESKDYAVGFAFGALDGQACTLP